MSPWDKIDLAKLIAIAAVAITIGGCSGCALVQSEGEMTMEVEDGQ